MRRFFIFSFVFVLFISSCFFVYAAEGDYIVYSANEFYLGTPTAEVLTSATNTSVILDTYGMLTSSGAYGTVGQNINTFGVTNTREFLNSKYINTYDGSLRVDVPGEDFPVINDINKLYPSRGTFWQSLYTSRWTYSYSTSGTPAPTLINIATGSMSKYPSFGYSEDGIRDWYICNPGEQISMNFSFLIRLPINNSFYRVSSSDFTAEFMYIPYEGGLRRDDYAPLFARTVFTVSPSTITDDLGRYWQKVDVNASFIFDYANPYFANGFPLGVTNYRFESFIVRWHINKSAPVWGPTLEIGTGFFTSQKLDSTGNIIPPINTNENYVEFEDILNGLNNSVGNVEDKLDFGVKWFNQLWNWGSNAVKSFSGVVDAMFINFPTYANILYALILLSCFGYILRKVS